jgi:hypothetical protein
MLGGSEGGMVYVTCKLKKSQPHKLHIWFLPTLKANAQKPKEQFLANA